MTDGVGFDCAAGAFGNVLVSRSELVHRLDLEATTEATAELMRPGVRRFAIQSPVTVASPTIARVAERVAARLLAGKESSAVTFREVVQFLDDVRLLDVDAVAAAVRDEPPSTGDRRWDALIAAAVDWVAVTRCFGAPEWTSSPDRHLPAPGWVVTTLETLHELVRAATPVQFAAHGVFLDETSLTSV